jgi:hypothetical protein
MGSQSGRLSFSNEPLAGKRLSVRPIDLIVRSISTDAHLELSAHVVRYICLGSKIW